MSLIFTDGCVKTSVVAQIYPTANVSDAYVAGKGAFGTPAISAAPNQTLPVVLAANFVTIFCNFWFQLGLLGSFPLWQAFDTTGAAQQVSLNFNAGGQLILQRGATVLATASQLFATNVLYQLEIKTVIDPTTGSVEVRLLGNPSPIINFTGNTRNTANTQVNEFLFGPAPNATGGNIYISHLSIYDTAGAAPNGFIGMKRIYTVVPTGDSATGGLNAFTTSPVQAGGSHWQNVKEEPPDDDTSYNFSSTVAQRESYILNGLPAGVATITVVNAFARMRIDDAGPHSVNITARTGTTDILGTAQFIGPTYLYYNQPFPIDPTTTVAWTPSGFGTGTNSTAEFGVKMAS